MCRILYTYFVCVVKFLFKLNTFHFKPGSVISTHKCHEKPQYRMKMQSKRKIKIERATKRNTIKLSALSKNYRKSNFFKENS